MSRLDAAVAGGVVSGQVAELPVVDAHCHGFQLDALRRRPAEGLIGRMTLMGMCAASSASLSPAAARLAGELAEDTVFAQAMRRWLAAELDCPPAEVEATRAARLAGDAPAYLRGLLERNRVAALLVDDGYPLPPVDQAELAATIGRPVHRVARIELLIADLAPASGDWAELEERFRAALEDLDAVAYKTVIAYRTGLDVAPWDDAAAERSFQAWRASGFKASRELSKPCHDRLLLATLEVARRQGRPVHIHSGAGDPDVVLGHVRPADLGWLLAEHDDQPIVLIHAGYPWLEEAAYLAAVYPAVYLELSLHVPWVTLDMERVFRTALGSVPAAKILYGSDEASEPEVIPFAAAYGRAALGRVLDEAVARDFVEQRAASRMAAAILGGNALALHGLRGAPA
jgi:predicted TIM-barrel fold metal-dependent hydrolase